MEKIYIDDLPKNFTPAYNSKKDSDFKMWASEWDDYHWKKAAKTEISVLALVSLVMTSSFWVVTTRYVFLSFSFNTVLFSPWTKVDQIRSMIYSTGTWTSCQNTLFKYKKKSKVLSQGRTDKKLDILSYLYSTICHWILIC